MSAVVGVRCDGCGTAHAKVTVVQPAAGPTRSRLKREGWHTTRGEYETVSGKTFGYTRDICPACWTAGKR